jgi:PadR family transcriptional regulator, regulatory protein PadR
MSRQTEILKGTLDLLILRSLELEPRHGVGIAERIEQVTRGTFVVKPGSLFPALHRLEAKGFIEGEWKSSPAGLRARLYELTALGRRQLSAEKKEWSRIALAVSRMLEEQQG